MSEQTGPVWTFVQALPAHLRARLNRTERLVALVHKAVNDQGWTARQLAAECARSNNTAVNAAGVIMFRLEQAAEHGPVAATGGKRVHFGCCEGGWIYPDDAEPIKCAGNPPTEVTA